MLINGGNKAAHDFFEEYDLGHDTSQKKYNTVAAQFYRERLKRSLDGQLAHPVEKERPDWDKGREVI